MTTTIPSATIPDFLTTQQAADALGVKRRNILDLIDRKRLKATRVGNAWLILPADLDAKFECDHAVGSRAEREKKFDYFLPTP